MFKWLLNLNEFDYNKFDCEWLLQCGSKLQKELSKNEIVRKNIVDCYKKQYNDILDKTKINDIIVRYFI